MLNEESSLGTKPQNELYTYLVQKARDLNRLDMAVLNEIPAPLRSVA